MGGCGGPEITGFLWGLCLEGMVVLKELIFNRFLYYEGLMALEELVLNSFDFGSLWCS